MQLPMKKYSVSFRILTVKDNSHTDLRTSHAQLLGNSSHYREEDSEDKILLQKEYITDKKVKIIEIIFQLCLPAGCECTGHQLHCLLRYE